jgi:hypothetical protein
MRARAILGFLAFGTLILGCGGDDGTGPPQPQPQPGELQVTVSGDAALGGIFLTVTGGAMAAPASASGAGLYYDLSEATLNATVVGSSLPGAVLTFAVPDTRDVANYVVSIQQVAGTSNQPLSSEAFAASVSIVP